MVSNALLKSMKQTNNGFLALEWWLTYRGIISNLLGALGGNLGLPGRFTSSTSELGWICRTKVSGQKSQDNFPLMLRKHTSHNRP